MDAIAPMRLVQSEADARARGFHELFYYRRLWNRCTYMGVPCYKNPLDMWIYQEIIHETRPDTIIECGTAFGGSALYLAHLLDQLGSGRVVTIDIVRRPSMPLHPRIEYIEGSSVEPRTIDRVERMLHGSERAMLILDSLHTAEHVHAELVAYAPMVSVGCYAIVEDTNINGHPVWTDFAPDAGPGAFEAVERFLTSDTRFEVDDQREKFLFTFNPRGYLRRVR